MSKDGQLSCVLECDSCHPAACPAGAAYPTCAPRGGRSSCGANRTGGAARRGDGQGLTPAVRALCY